MTIGRTVTKQSLDADLANSVIAVRNSLDDMARLQDYLARTADADLVTMGYTQAEVTTIKSAISAMDNMRQALHGGASIPTPTDHMQFAKQLTGID